MIHAVAALLAAALPASPLQEPPPSTQPETTTMPRLPDGFVTRTIDMPDGGRRKYVVFIPPQYDRDKTHRWPVILFLHGSGERGRDGISHTKVGLPRYIAARPRRFPFITVMPQVSTMWFRGDNEVMVWRILDAVHEAYRTDRDRVYLTGLSMGGFAAWELSMARPDVFAAVVPVCGMGPPEYVANIRGLPVWAFHGAKDPAVPPSGSRDPVAELRRLGAKPKYTEYPDLAHNCWDRAYATQELWRWLLRKRRPPPPSTIDYRFPGGEARVWWLAVKAAPDHPPPSTVRAEIDDDGGRVTLTTEGVVSCALISDGDPLRPGRAIEVIWNGTPAYRGEFTGELGLTMKVNEAPASPP